MAVWFGESDFTFDGYVIRPEEYEGMTTVQISDMAFRMMLDDLGPDFAPLEKGEATT